MSDMTDHAKQNYKNATDRLEAITKPLRNLAWLMALLVAAWAQFLGPGITYVVREMSGSNELSEKMEELFSRTNLRLEFIEQNIAPPRVANWNFNRQLGDCTPEDCRVLHNISRTAYGQNCGVPTATAEIKIGNSGQLFDLQFGAGFEPADATLTGRNFIVPLVIQDYIPDGTHEYRFINIYPSCEWSLEPIPRQSPWFQITVHR